MQDNPFAASGQPLEIGLGNPFTNATGAEVLVMAPELARHRPRRSIFSPGESYLHLASLGIAAETRSAAVLESALREIKRRYRSGEAMVPDRRNRHARPHLYWVDFITLRALLTECLPSRLYLDEEALWWQPIGD